MIGVSGHLMNGKTQQVSLSMDQAVPTMELAMGGRAVAAGRCNADTPCGLKQTFR